jgi:hypothetical protein
MMRNSHNTSGASGSLSPTYWIAWVSVAILSFIVLGVVANVLLGWGIFFLGLLMLGGL